MNAVRLRLRARSLLLLGGLLATTSVAGADWADLWSRPDQRAQQLLDSGKAAAAAPLFQDPRRRAYAEIKAQDYAAAAKQLQGASDPESLYNRGNALARAGDLEAGLQAYEAALKQVPKESALYRDAAHNREVVSQQLKKQKQQQQGGQGQDKGQDKNQGQGKDQEGGKGQDQSKDQGEQGKDQGQQGKDQGQQGKDQGQQGKDQGQQGKDQGQGKDQPSGKDPSQKSGGDSKDQGQGKDADKESAAQAQEEARAAAQSQQQKEQTTAAQRQAQSAQAAQQQSKGQASQAQSAADQATDKGADKTRGAADGRPESEQALALDQWLRWIPDDPAGLLRRKFMIEHMLKQQQENRP